MTPIASICACGEDAATIQLGWGWCEECYYDLMLLCEEHARNPGPRVCGKAKGKPHAAKIGVIAGRDQANRHEKTYHGGNAPHD